MIELSFAKILSPNDVGETNSHQAGICIPKSDSELLEFFPKLDPRIKNDDTWIVCVDEDSNDWHFRYVYYNNKFHDPKGTRNEFRLTHMTKYFNSAGAKSGDKLILSKKEKGIYGIRLTPNTRDNWSKNHSPNKVKLTGWTRLH